MADKSHAVVFSERMKAADKRHCGGSVELVLLFCGEEADRHKRQWRNSAAALISVGNSPGGRDEISSRAFGIHSAFSDGQNSSQEKRYADHAQHEVAQEAHSLLLLEKLFTVEGAFHEAEMFGGVQRSPLLKAHYGDCTCLF